MAKKGLLLISSGIDSPVAGYLAMKGGVELVAVHFDNQPLTNDLPKQKVKKLVTRIAQIFNKKIKLYIVTHGVNQVEFLKNCNRRALCVLCRRMMFRVAEKIAEKEKCDFLITGENLGQVASQTLQNMANAEEAVKIKIIRPILCNDKQETIKIARDIGTYDLSIEAGMCCSAVPKNPFTSARLNLVHEEEQKIDVSALAKKAMATVEVVVLP